MKMYGIAGILGTAYRPADNPLCRLFLSCRGNPYSACRGFPYKKNQAVTLTDKQKEYGRVLGE